ncbi:MAG TPA: TIGR02530 family flagellar biosynthesis protein [Candidatus Baltobacteraceae bacterium]|nr:TIGR02530 family flagellar biosynthesis protein [Candidatus Baltobacteraceae bacterium]
MDPNDIKVNPVIIPGPAPRPQGTPVQIPPGQSFRSILEQQKPGRAEPLKFSAHAMQRLQSRNIQLSSEDVSRMNAMADKAAEKGAKQSLFMLKDVAMVVSIKNRTVITAVDQQSMKENVFTNIDSAAIIG